MHIQYLYYIHTHLDILHNYKNSKLYNISAIWTVAQNTILIYSNTFFFFYNVQVQTVHTIKCKAQAPKRPQKCMLSGQLEATGREDWHESAEESCQYQYRSFSTLPTAVSCKINS